MAEALRVDCVRIQSDDQTVEISWTVTQELQARLLRHKATKRLVEKLQRVEVSRPVVVDESDFGPLLVVLAQWAKEVGSPRLPAGIDELLEALQTDVQ